MTRFRTLSIVAASFFAILLAVNSSASAAWVFQGNVNGVPTYLDTNTGLTWTVTLGRVPSNQNGATARQAVSQMGFRLPTFQELQAMYNFSGGRGTLGIRNGVLDYYETANANLLGNAFGNGFQTPQQRKGAGHNWYIGVR